MDILWRRRSRVSKARHLKGCIKKLPGSSLVGQGGGWREAGWANGGGGREAGWVGWGRGSSVKPQKAFH